jgi:hypothetical protein
MQEEFLIICDKCKNEIIAKDNSIIVCNVCGNKIDNRKNTWHEQESTSPKKKRKTGFIIFLIFIALWALRYYISYESKETKEINQEILQALFVNPRTINYKIDEKIPLEKGSDKMPFWGDLEEVSDLTYEVGNGKDIFIKLISFTPKSKEYTDLKNIQDSIKLNYLGTIADSTIIQDQSFKIYANNSAFCKSFGYLVIKEKHVNFQILSDYESKLNKNWHLLIVYNDIPEINMEVDRIIASRQIIIDGEVIE